MGWNYLSIPKLRRCNRWSLGMDKSFHPRLYQAGDYLSTLGFKLNYFSKRNPWCWNWNIPYELDQFYDRWLLASPGHQKLWYWKYRIAISTWYSSHESEPVFKPRWWYSWRCVIVIIWHCSDVVWVLWHPKSSTRLFVQWGRRHLSLA